MITMRSTLTLVSLAAAALMAGCSDDSAELAPPDFTPLQASVAQARAITADRVIEVYGTVQPTVQSFVSARVMGPVVQVRAFAGATVKKGETLVKIQPEASAGQLAQTQGALAQADAARILAERNLKRYQALHAEGAASDVELDMAQMQYEQAAGAVEQARGAVQTAQSMAGDADVTAPFAARVVEKLVEVGDMAAPGRPLVRLESLAGRRMWLTVRQADIQRFSVGQNLPVTLDSRPDLGTIEAKVAEVVPSGDAATHTFTVKLDLGNIDVPSGLSGRAFLPGDSVERIVIPSGAVHHRGGLELVIVVAGDGTTRTHAVTVGASMNDGTIEVLSGIKDGASVVIDATAPVADGTPVEVRS